MALERLSWHITCLNHVSVRLLTVVRRGSGGLTRKLILRHTQSLVFMVSHFSFHFISFCDKTVTRLTNSFSVRLRQWQNRVHSSSCVRQVRMDNSAMPRVCLPHGMEVHCRPEKADATEVLGPLPLRTRPQLSEKCRRHRRGRGCHRGSGRGRVDSGRMVIL